MREEIERLAKLERAEEHTKKGHGGVLFSSRMQQIASLAASQHEGDLIEIGCYSGTTSIRLAAVAKETNRKLVCVDNWVPGTGWDHEGAERGFLKDMKPFAEWVEIVRMDAHSEEAIERIKQRKYCFALSDDGHSYEDHLSELMTLLPITTGVVVADDIYYKPVPRAVADTLKQFPDWMEIRGEGGGGRRVWIGSTILTASNPGKMP